MIDNAVDIPPLTKWVEKFLVQKKVDDFIPPFMYVDIFNNNDGVTPGGGGSGRGTPGGGGGRRTGAGGTLGVNALGTRVSNANIDPRFQDGTMHNKILCGRIKTLKAGLEQQQPPICCPVSPHKQLCLSWHIKGYCYSGCNRMEDHVQLVRKHKDGMFWYAQAMFP